MVMVKFKEGGRCGVFNLEQIKIRPCGKVVAPFGLVQMREVYQLFSEWFDSVGFGDMTDREKDWLWFGFSVGYCHDNNKAALSALQQLLEIYDDQSGKVWTTSSKRRALDNARAAVNKALGETK